MTPRDTERKESSVLSPQSSVRRARRRAFGLTELVLAIFALLVSWLGLAGCAQNTEPDFTQYQTPAAPTEQAQVQDTYGGHTLRFDVRQTDGLPMGGNIPPDMAPDRVALIRATAERAAADGLTVDSPIADLIQFQVWNVSTGATTTPTGTQSSAPQVASTATGTQTTTPTQTVSPETGIALPVAVAMPGGVADSTAAASGGAGSANQDKQGNHTATAQMLETLRDQPELAQEFLRILAGQPAPGTPTPAPDATTNGE